MIEIIAYIFIGIGLFFDFIGCLGLIRLPDLYNRLQASTKCVTLGTCGIMLGVFFIHRFNGIGIKALLCAAFLLLTSPVSAHAIARGAHLKGFKLWEKSVCDKYEEDSNTESR